MIVGVGIDLVEIDRVERMLDARGERMLRRLFTEGEAAYAMRGAHPAQHLAARLAAKEAAFKALAGNELARGIGWKEMEVARGADGRPSLILHGRAWTRAAELGVTAIHLSLTHARDTAAAVVVLEG